LRCLRKDWSLARCPAVRFLKLQAQ
jgi:hypothetical protein